MTPKDTYAGGMESHDPYSLTAGAYDLVHTLSHFSGSLICKGYGHDIIRIDIALLYKICNTMGKYPGLAGTGAGNNKKRPVNMSCRFTLSVI